MGGTNIAILRKERSLQDSRTYTAPNEKIHRYKTYRMKFVADASGYVLVRLLCVVGLAFLVLTAALLFHLENDNLIHVPENVVMSFNSTVSEIAAWPFQFLHIVNTRFMQHQGNLTKLAQARLVLFENFCLPSMTQQSLLRSGQSPAPYLWIIKVDPELEDGILQNLILLVKAYPFVYVVASNVNFGIGVHEGGWRGGEAGNDILGSKIYTGDLNWLKIAHISRNDKVVLETRLDADDGLHVTYLEVIQTEATKRLMPTHFDTNISQQAWMYWCPLNRLEWKPSPPHSVSKENGIFLPIQAPHVCITAGITLGISVGTKEISVPRFPHQSLYKELLGNKIYPSCGGDKCLELLAEPILGAIRSRTPTSAGMRGVVADRKEFSTALKFDTGGDPAIWSILAKNFHITKGMTAKANHYLQTHFQEVLEDNLFGQCTPGHSCKNSTKIILKKLLHKTNTRNEGLSMEKEKK